MSSLSRRDFLKLCGISLGTSALLPLADLVAQYDQSALFGRTLGKTAVYDQAAGQAIGQLFPDSVVSLIAETEGWYQTPDGFIPRTQIQPMPGWNKERITTLSTFPVLVEVFAPSAPVYSTASTTAPATARIGYGGVAQAIDYLPDTAGGWLALANQSGTLRGWSQAARWHERSTPQSHHIDQVVLSRQSHVLSAWQGETLVASFTACCATDIPVGTALLNSKLPFLWTTPHQATPWCINWSNGVSLTGAYWHNDFGSNSAQPFKIELSPANSRWLFQNLERSAQLLVQ
jgi:hypothetical protein